MVRICLGGSLALRPCGGQRAGEPPGTPGLARWDPAWWGGCRQRVGWAGCADEKHGLCLAPVSLARLLCLARHRRRSGAGSQESACAWCTEHLLCVRRHRREGVAALFPPRGRTLEVTQPEEMRTVLDSGCRAGGTLPLRAARHQCGPQQSQPTHTVGLKTGSLKCLAAGSNMWHRGGPFTPRMHGEPSLEQPPGAKASPPLLHPLLSARPFLSVRESSPTLVGLSKESWLGSSSVF